MNIKFRLSREVLENVKLAREAQLQEYAASEINPSGVARISFLSDGSHLFNLQHKKLVEWVGCFTPIPDSFTCEFVIDEENSFLLCEHEQSWIRFKHQTLDVSFTRNLPIQLNIANGTAILTNAFDPLAYKEQKKARLLARRFENQHKRIDKIKNEIVSVTETLEKRNQEIADMQEYIKATPFADALAHARLRHERQMIIQPIYRAVFKGFEDVKQRLLDLNLLTTESEMVTNDYGNTYDRGQTFQRYDSLWATFTAAKKKADTYSGYKQEEKEKRLKKLGQAHYQLSSFVERILNSWFDKLLEGETYQQKRKQIENHLELDEIMNPRQMQLKFPSHRPRVKTELENQIFELSEDLKLQTQILKKMEIKFMKEDNEDVTEENGKQEKRNSNVVVESNERQQEEGAIVGNENAELIDNGLPLVGIENTELITQGQSNIANSEPVEPDLYAFFEPEEAQGIKFSCSRVELLTELETVKRVIRKGTRIPYDSQVYFKAEYGYVEIIAKCETDSEEEALLSRVDPIEMEGNFGIVSIERLIKLLKASKNESVEIDITKDSAIIVLGKSKTTIQAENLSEFEISETYQNISFEDELWFDKEELAQAIDRVLYAAGDSFAFQNKTSLRAIKMQRVDNAIEVTAADGYRLAQAKIYKFDKVNFPAIWEAHLEKASVKLLYDLLKDKNLSAESQIIFAEQPSRKLTEEEKVNLHAKDSMRETTYGYFAFLLGQRTFITRESGLPQPGSDKTINQARLRMIRVKSDDFKELLSLSEAAVETPKNYPPYFAVIEDVDNEVINLHIHRGGEVDEFESTAVCAAPELYDFTAIDFLFSVDPKFLKEFLKLGTGELRIVASENNQAIEFYFDKDFFLLIAPLSPYLPTYESFFTPEYVRVSIEAAFDSIDAMTFAYRKVSDTDDPTHTFLGVTGQGWAIDKYIAQTLIERHYMTERGILCWEMVDAHGGWNEENVVNKEVRHCSTGLIKAVVSGLGGKRMAESILARYTALEDSEEKATSWRADCVGRTSEGWVITPMMLDEVLRRSVNMKFEEVMEDKSLDFDRFVAVVTSLIYAIGAPVTFEFLYENLIRHKDFDFDDAIGEMRIKRALERACVERRLQKLDEATILFSVAPEDDEQTRTGEFVQLDSALSLEDYFEVIEVPPLEGVAGTIAPFELDPIPAFDEVKPVKKDDTLGELLEEYLLMPDETDEPQTDALTEVFATEENIVIETEVIGGEDLTVINMQEFKEAKNAANPVSETAQQPATNVVELRKQPKTFEEFVELFDSDRQKAMEAALGQFTSKSVIDKMAIRGAMKLYNITKSSPPDELLYTVGDTHVTFAILSAAINEYEIQTLIDEGKYPQLDPLNTKPIRDAFKTPEELKDKQTLYNLYARHIQEYEGSEL